MARRLWRAQGDANYAPVLARLEDRVTRMESLARQQQGRLPRDALVVGARRGLRRRRHHELLRHLVTAAEVAALEEPLLAEKFRLPAGNGPNEVFRTLARQMLEQGQAQRELLAKHGLADRLLEDLAAAVDQFDASVAETNEGRRGHVGAGRDGGVERRGDAAGRAAERAQPLPVRGEGRDAGGVGDGAARGGGAAGRLRRSRRGTGR